MSETHERLAELESSKPRLKTLKIRLELIGAKIVRLSSLRLATAGKSNLDVRLFRRKDSSDAGERVDPSLPLMAGDVVEVAIVPHDETR